MSSVAAAPPPVNAVPATNGVTSEATAAPTTNNAGTAADATPAAAPAGENKPASPEETGHKVFAGNLAYATTDEGLKTFFNAFASDIVSSEVIQRGARPAGYGFVTFKTLEAAQNAVEELNDKELDGRPVIVQLAKPAAEKEKERNERRTKRRATGRRNARAPPGEVTEAEAEGQDEDSKPGLVEKAENAVEGAAAAVSDAIKPKKKKKWGRKGRGKKATAATGGTTEDEAVQTTDTPAGEPSAAGAEASDEVANPAPKRAKKPRAPRAPRPPRAAGEQPEGQPSKNMLFVANLAFSIDDARLKQIFTDAGINVVSARVVTRRWGPRRSKGFGFVDVGNEEEQKKALAHFAPVESTDDTTPAAGKEIEGRQIAVKIAVDAPKREVGETDVDAAANSAEKNEATPDTTVVAH
ncbi:RNA recognition motif protein [Rhizoctonia solani 123E]|uniref:RNA recognition motif protein n=1 Tax=Rhizoctonia solani 123E TaxID=1423351 RepID=A0A074RX80_9AGAM|nr:RNA recognition motif protein [Rhizoctonia solani 123E]